MSQNIFSVYLNNYDISFFSDILFAIKNNLHTLYTNNNYYYYYFEPTKRLPHSNSSSKQSNFWLRHVHWNTSELKIDAFYLICLKGLIFFIPKHNIETFFFLHVQIVSKSRWETSEIVHHTFANVEKVKKYFTEQSTFTKTKQEARNWISFAIHNRLEYPEPPHFLQSINPTKNHARLKDVNKAGCMKLKWWCPH